VHPVKVAETEKIESILLQLQRVLSANPPPWLRKALHKSRARTIDYEDGVVYE
jgi:nitrogen fixation protein NifX